MFLNRGLSNLEENNHCNEKSCFNFGPNSEQCCEYVMIMLLYTIKQCKIAFWKCRSCLSKGFTWRKSLRNTVDVT